MTAFAALTKPGPVSVGTWHHGDQNRRTTFVDQRDRRRGTSDPNALGPGVYWSRDLTLARGYAFPYGWIYEATMRTTPRRTMTDRSKPTAAFFGKLIDACPAEVRNDNLANYDENLRVARAKAVEAALFEVWKGRPLDGAIGIFHEVYGWDAKLFVPAMVKLGWDCYVSPTDILVVWNAAIIQVTGETQYTPAED